MNIIEEIRSRLEKYPDARYESNGHSITVLPATADGFSVGVFINRDKSHTVFFAGWHEEVQDPEEALNLFAFGLSDECRLVEHRRGNFAYKWTVEARENGRWVEQSTTGLLLFPFWKRREVRYLQNNLLRR